MFVRASFYMRREENQLAATEWLIELVICSKCFGHLYAPHRELETILLLLPLMVCNALVAGGRRLVCRAAGYASAMRDAVERHLTDDHQQPRHYTPYAVITHV